MADTIKVPGIKDPLPKTAVLGGVAVTGVAIIVYFRNRSSAAAAGPAADSTGLASGGLAPDSGLLAGDTSGAYTWDGTYGDPSDPYSLDTTTGQTYGNEGYAGGFGAGLGGGGAGDTGTAPGPPFSNNQQWSAYVLAQDAGAHPNMTEALGLYLDGKTLTTDQQDLVYQAQAIAGPVPVSGPGGYPPKLRTAASTGKPKGGTVFAVNPVENLHARAANSAGLLPPPGGKGPRPKASGIEISWDKADHATGYQVSVTNQTAHRTALSPVTTVKTSYTVSGLQSGDTYQVTVLAKPAEKGARAAEAQVRA